MWFWKRRSFGDDFLEGFRVQRIGIADAIAIAEFPPDQIEAYFRRNPVIADRLLLESYDKRSDARPFQSLIDPGDEKEVPRAGHDCARAGEEHIGEGVPHGANAKLIARIVFSE